MIPTAHTASVLEQAMLKPGELQFLRFLADGKTNGEIAAAMGKSQVSLRAKRRRIRACLAAVTGRQDWTQEDLADFARSAGLGSNAVTQNGGGVPMSSEILRLMAQLAALGERKGIRVQLRRSWLMARIAWVTMRNGGGNGEHC